MADTESSEYVTKKINPILEDMVQAVLMTKPVNPIPFMITFLRERSGEVQISQSEKEELLMLRAEMTRLRTKLGNVSDAETSDEDESDEDDIIEELPQRTAAQNRPRNSVSDQAFGTWNKATEYVPRVIEKTEEQKTRISDRLSSAFMFEALDDNERNIVINAMEERKASPGDLVIEQGGDGNELFVVDSGELECSKVFKTGAEATYLKDYLPGDAFGELALLYNAPRAATIKAKTDCVLWVLDRDCFTHIVKRSASNKRERYESFLAKVELLENMEPYERSKISDAFKTASYAAEENIINEGEWGEVFYIIEEGEAIATKTLTAGMPPEQVLSYGPGDYFGELSLMKGEPRAANVIAKTGMKCVTLDRHSFKRMLGPLDEILRRNAAKYETILSKK